MVKKGRPISKVLPDLSRVAETSRAAGTSRGRNVGNRAGGWTKKRRLSYKLDDSRWGAKGRVGTRRVRGNWRHNRLETIPATFDGVGY